MIDARVEISRELLELTQKRIKRTLTPRNFKVWSDILLDEVKESARGLTKSQGRWWRDTSNFPTPLADTFVVSRIGSDMVTVSSRRVYAGVHEGNKGATSSYIPGVGGSKKWMTVPAPGTSFPRASELLRSGRGFILKGRKGKGGVIAVREGNDLTIAYYFRRRVKVEAQHYISKAMEKAILRIRDRIDTYLPRGSKK